MCSGACCLRHPHACALLPPPPPSPLCSGACCATHPQHCPGRLHPTGNASRVKKLFDSGRFWERRYARGGDSGAGSYGALAEYKAQFLNKFVAEKGLVSVIEFGCGDGNQLALSLRAYRRYTGVDVSRTVLSRLQQKFRREAHKVAFLHTSKYNASLHMADLALSLDVIFHLVEDSVFELYMERLFSAARRFVVVFSSNEDMRAHTHVRHRHFSSWVDRRRGKEAAARGQGNGDRLALGGDVGGTADTGLPFSWRLLHHEPHPMGCNPRTLGCGGTSTSSFASFYVFARTAVVL